MEYPAVRLAAWAEKDAQRDAVSRVQIHRAMGIRTELSLGEVGAWIRFAGFRLNSREQRRVRRMQRLEGAQKDSI